MDFGEALIAAVVRAVWASRRFAIGRHPAGSPLSAAFAFLTSQFLPIASDGELDSLLPTANQRAGDFLDRKRYLYLQAPLRGASVLPLLAIKYDMRGSAPELRIRVVLFHAAAVAPKIELKAVGFRFET